MTQCAEDSTDEERTRRVLSFANGDLIAVKMTLESWAKMLESENASA